jgi:HPt (histidine-containing phosphotransfer) domain-containing protein
MSHCGGMGDAVDFEYLETFAAGDAGVVRDILGLFVEQAKGWETGLASPDAGWADLVHTIKGTSRGIGARRLGDLAARAEEEGPGSAPLLLGEVRAARQEVEAYLAQAR